MKTAPHSVTRTWLAPLCLGLTLPLSMVLYAGCKKDEPPPPLPSAAPATTPSAPVELVVEDAGEDVEDASDASDAKKGVGVPTSSMKACCNALAQNAASAPPPTNMYMQAAAAACSTAVAQSKDKSTISGIVSGMLKGAQMPAACR